MKNSGKLEAVSPETASAVEILRKRSQAPIASRRLGALDVEIKMHDDLLWVVLRRDGEGGVALRLPLFANDCQCRVVNEPDTLATIECAGSLGTARLILTAEPFGLEQMRATFAFTPTRDLRLSWLPRDLVPFDADGDPMGAHGQIEASQRNLNTGLLYFSLRKPRLGKLLYVQNFTSLNGYFNATGSTPDSTVGGKWPDIGYQLPRNPDSGEAILPANRTLTLYDTILAIRGYPQREEESSAWQFLDMLGAVYPWLTPPEAVFRNWEERARGTIRDLARARAVRVRHYGHVYFHPYIAAEYPDIMVQLSIASALNDWGLWAGGQEPLLRQIIAGLNKFYDPALKTLRRYLPNVGDDKDPDAVDSWYFYHPMLNLANLALSGVEEAKDLFLKSIDYGIRAAQHFNYRWPIMYNVRDFSVIREVAEADGRGQTDVGGIYAWVMLQAFELTHDPRFLDEAKNALDAAEGMRFNLNYQANLTAWGAAACIKLWRMTDHKAYLARSYVYLASFFHNAQLWESEIGLARHWRNFLGVTCLQDAHYMAAYECFDSFAAFERYLDYGGPDLIPSVKLLVGEYCRLALDRAWYYYPDALPEEALATEIRNGHIDRSLNFPLEDLYSDGQKAGQVGQEIYGSGAAIVFATRACRRIEDAPFLLFCNVFIRAMHRIDDHTVSMKLDGHELTEALLVLIPSSPAKKFRPRLAIAGERVLALDRHDKRWQAKVPANATLLFSWM